MVVYVATHGHDPSICKGYIYLDSTVGKFYQQRYIYLDSNEIHQKLTKNIRNKLHIW